MKKKLFLVLIILSVGLFFIKGKFTQKFFLSKKVNVSKTVPNRFSQKNKTLSKVDILPVTKQVKMVQLLFIKSPFPCSNCEKIKRLTEYSLKRQFVDEQKNKLFRYKVIDTGFKKNEHFILKYGIKRSELILQKIKENKVMEWKALWKVYWYLDKPQDFRKYLLIEIKNYLKDAKKP